MSRKTLITSKDWAPVKKNTQVGRDNCQQIHYTIEARGVLEWLCDYIQPQNVFDGEKYCKYPLNGVQKVPDPICNTLRGLEHHDNYTEKDGDQKRHVKGFASWRFCFKNDLVNKIATRNPLGIIVCHPLCD